MHLIWESVRAKERSMERKNLNDVSVHLSLFVRFEVIYLEYGSICVLQNRAKELFTMLYGNGVYVLGLFFSISAVSRAQVKYTHLCKRNARDKVNNEFGAMLIRVRIQYSGGMMANRALIDLSIVAE